MPDLYVIAGPNGAGKSTMSRDLVFSGIEIFDGDKEFARLEQTYPDIDVAHLHTVVLEDLFEERKAAAIQGGHDFAYETNFATENAIHIPQQFRQAGYDLNLIYIGLSNEKNAIERVSFRVKMGGHQVESDQIFTNYRDGLKNLEKYIGYFDKARVYHSVRSLEMRPPRLLYAFEKGTLLRQQQPIPKWARHLPVESQTPPIKNEIKTSRGLKR
jgi:predicted ABC-type ATPase